MSIASGGLGLERVGAIVERPKALLQSSNPVTESAEASFTTFAGSSKRLKKSFTCRSGGGSVRCCCTSASFAHTFVLKLSVVCWFFGISGVLPWENFSPLRP